MVFTLVILSIVVLVTADYFYFGKRVDAALAAARAEGRAPPAAAGLPLPPGALIQPTWTWSRLGEAGEIYVGLNPMLTALVGAPFQLECVARGANIAKGEPMVRFGAHGRRLTVRAPVSGRVELVNDARLADGDEEPWLYQVTPDRLADELPRWLSGEAARRWSAVQYARLREYLGGAVHDRRLGTVMADGGELPAGMLGALDEAIWAGLDERLSEWETTP